MVRNFLLLLLFATPLQAISDNQVEEIDSQMRGSELIRPAPKIYQVTPAIAAPVNLSNQTIPANNTFTLIHFEDEVNFTNTTFPTNPQFIWSVFDKEANFSFATFADGAEFYEALFKGGAIFFRTTFTGPAASFIRTAFRERVEFRRASFHGKLLAAHATFDRGAAFNGAWCDGPVDLHHAVFGEAVDFSRVAFSSILDLSHVRFLGPAYFGGAVLPEYLNLAHITEIAEELDFTRSLPPTTKKKVVVNLVGADLSKIELPYDIVKLYFPPGTNERSISAVYETILNSLSAAGYESDHERFAIEYQRWQYLVNGQHFVDKVDQYWWNYGFSKGRIFLWIVIFLVLFGAVNTVIYRKLMKEGVRIPFLEKLSEDEVTERNPILHFIFYLPLALIYTTLVFFGTIFGMRLPMGLTQDRARNLAVHVYLIAMMILGTALIFFIIRFIFN